MPFKYEIDHTLHKVHTSITGSVTRVDIERHLAKEEREAGLMYPEIIDARGVTVDLNPMDVRMLVATLKGLNVNNVLGPTAVLVSTDLNFGMLRMLSMLVGDTCEIEPFRTIEEAERWLDKAPLSMPPSIAPPGAV